jgi:excisionase family DNA binding protein
VARKHEVLGDEFLTREELAIALRTSKRTLARWEKAGVAPPRTLLGRKFLYRREAVQKWLKDREQALSSAKKGQGGRSGAKAKKRPESR